METNMDIIAQLKKALALEAGNYDAAPSTLTQGAALQREELDDIMHSVTVGNDQLSLQKEMDCKPYKSNLVQFTRQLSHGILGGSARTEGLVGQEEVSDYIRATVPMSYYSELRRTTLVANIVATFDGTKAEDRASESAALRLGCDIEMDCFRGQADFSNAGIFDGNPLLLPQGMPNMQGVDLQVRQSDARRDTQDLMFAEFGSGDSVVINGNGSLTQEMVDDAALRSSLGFGKANELFISPKVLQGYNKILLAYQRNVLGGSPQTASGSDLQTQWTTVGAVKLKSHQFLRGKTGAAPYHVQSGLTNASMTITIASAAGSAPTDFVAGNVFFYVATPCNFLGEGPACPAVSRTITATGDTETVTINHPSAGTVEWFNVYRTVAGATAGKAKFIGRVVINKGGSSTTFVDLDNKNPGFATGFLIQKDSMGLKEMAPFSRAHMAITDLTTPEAFFRFVCLAVKGPRFNALIDNLAE